MPELKDAQGVRWRVRRRTDAAAGLPGHAQLGHQPRAGEDVAEEKIKGWRASGRRIAEIVDGIRVAGAVPGA